MPLDVGENEFQCKLRFRLEGDPEESITTIGVKRAAADGRDVIDIAHEVWAAWDGALGAATLAQGWSFVGVDVARGPIGVGEVGSWDEVVVGAHTSPVYPQNCALLVKKKTALGGKRNSGRMFLPAGFCFEEEISRTGELSQGLLGSYQTKIDQFFANLTDEPALTPVLFHNVPALQEPEPSTPIVKLVLDPVIATQRRRLRR